VRRSLTTRDQQWAIKKLCATANIDRLLEPARNPARRALLQPPSFAAFPDVALRLVTPRSRHDTQFLFHCTVQIHVDL
jgi:hypothetical protein